MTIKKLAKAATDNSNKKYTPDRLSHIMQLSTLQYDDAEFFAKLLDYKIEFIKTEEL